VVDTLHVERDKLVAFAWSRDGRHLFARTLRGAVHWWSWDDPR
jgi:hypothetical protein